MGLGGDKAFYMLFIGNTGGKLAYLPPMDDGIPMKSRSDFGKTNPEFLALGMSKAVFGPQTS